MEFDLVTAVNVMCGVIAGGLITWIAARVYYKKASDDLKKEARKLNIIGNKLQKLYEKQFPDSSNLILEDEGNITGDSVKVSPPVQTMKFTELPPKVSTTREKPSNDD